MEFPSVLDGDQFHGIAFIISLEWLHCSDNIHIYAQQRVVEMICVDNI